MGKKQHINMQQDVGIRKVNWGAKYFELGWGIT